MILTETKETLDDVMNTLKGSFEITVCSSNYFVGIQIERDREKNLIFIHQKNHIERMLTRFGTNDAKSVSVPMDPHSVASIMEDKGEGNKRFPYREAIGSLMFLSQLTRPDITYVVNLMNRLLTCYNEAHWRAVKRIFRYLTGTNEFGICYRRSHANPDLLGYSDADYAGDIVTRRSTTGYIFLLFGEPISWYSQRQKSVSLNTTEAKYVAASMANRELIWIQRLLGDIHNPCTKAIEFMIDNQSAIKLVRNPEFHKRSKHIDIHFHFIREKLLEGNLYVRLPSHAA